MANFCPARPNWSNACPCWSRALHQAASLRHMAATTIPIIAQWPMPSGLSCGQANCGLRFLNIRYGFQPDRRCALRFRDTFEALCARSRWPDWLRLSALRLRSTVHNWRMAMVCNPRGCCMMRSSPGLSAMMKSSSDPAGWSEIADESGAALLPFARWIYRLLRHFAYDIDHDLRSWTAARVASHTSSPVSSQDVEELLAWQEAASNSLGCPNPSWRG